MLNQYMVYLVLIIVLAMFIRGSLRYDIVALLALTIAGIVPGDEAFNGFSHPAVITVAAVLILSRALMNSGIVDSVSRFMSRNNKPQNIQLAILVAAVPLIMAVWPL